MPANNYPPVVFKPRLRETIDYHLRNNREDKRYNPETWLIAKLGISNVTAKRILDGCDVRLGRAIKIAKLLDQEIDYLWNL